MNQHHMAIASAWIFVEERLPPNGRRVLVTTHVRNVAIAVYAGVFGWRWDDGSPMRATVIAWQETPAPATNKV